MCLGKSVTRFGEISPLWQNLESWVYFVFGKTLRLLWQISYAIAHFLIAVSMAKYWKDNVVAIRSHCSENENPASRSSVYKFFFMLNVSKTMEKVLAEIFVCTAFIKWTKWSLLRLNFLPVWPDWAIFLTLGNFFKAFGNN